MQRSPGNRRRWQVKQADCFTALPRLDADSVDAIVTDPPYGIGVNGMAWDRPARLDPSTRAGKRRRRPSENPNQAFQEFSREWSSACLHSLKPGGHLAAFAAPRTAHRLACGLEEAGFELRDVLMWLQGQGYPATRVLPGGLATGLKPAWEPIILARKPLDGTLDHNLKTHGTGAMNIDATRIALSAQDCPSEGRAHGQRITASERGRWPANLLLSHARHAPPRAASRTARSGYSGTATASSTQRRPTDASARPAARSCPDESRRRSRSAPTTRSCARPTPSRTSTRRSSRSS